MGYFSPFYYLKYLLRRLPKKLLVFICIFLIVCVCHLKGYCADDVNAINVPNADVVELYRKQVDHNYYVFTYMNIIKALNNNGVFDSNFKTFCIYATTRSNVAFGIYSSNYYNLYFNRNGTYLNDAESWLCLAWADKSSYIDQDTVVIPGTSNTNYSSSRQLSCSVYNNATIFRGSFSSANPNIYGNTGYTVTLIDAFSNYIPNDLYDILYSIGNDTFSFTSDNQVLQEISQKIDETNEQLEQMNEFFNSTTTPTISNNDLPSDNLTDITSSGFDGIFTRLFEATNTTTIEQIIIPIPYLNYSFTVRSNYLENIIRGWEVYLPNAVDGSILTLIYIIWRFIIYRYIVLDIYKYINDFKNGNISKTDTNIKADML